MDSKNGGKRKRTLILGIIVLTVIIIILLCLRCCNNTASDNTENLPERDTSETTNQGLDFVPADDESKHSIQIPAMTGMYLKAGQLEQTVDFYNPKDNNCFFVLSLYLSDGTLIYKSDMLAPSEHITDITLSQELQRGLYRNCRLVYNCYSLDGKTPLNGSNVVIEINSQ